MAVRPSLHRSRITTCIQAIDFHVLKANQSKPKLMTHIDRTVPALAINDVATQCTDLYSLTGTFNPLDGEVDQTFLLQASDGRQFTVKVCDAETDSSTVELEAAILQHLERINPDLEVPKVVRSNNGRSSETFSWQEKTYTLRILTFVAGTIYSATDPDDRLWNSLGALMGRIGQALVGFSHPNAHRSEFIWNLDAAFSCRSYASTIVDRNDREMVERVFAHYQQAVMPQLPALRRAVIHGDANDNNLVVDEQNRVCGLFDFGDVSEGYQVYELAITLAYALMGVDDIIGAAQTIIAAYVQHMKLSEAELDVLFALLELRLAVSICISSYRASTQPDRSYHTISQRAAIDLLRRLGTIHHHLKVAIARDAAGLPAIRTQSGVEDWLQQNQSQFASVFDFDLKTTPRCTISLSKGAPGSELADKQSLYSDWLDDWMEHHQARIAIGLYGEARDCYTSEQFVAKPGTPARTVHLGIDLFVAAGTVVQSPLPGTVYAVHNNAFDLDYGWTVILKHQAGEGGPEFFTLYGHLASDCAERLRVGQDVATGERIASVGKIHENGGWAPHLHFQIMTHMLGETTNFIGACEAERLSLWASICPDPNLILNLAEESFDLQPPETANLMQRRNQVLGRSLSVSYKDKLTMVRGKGCWLIDATGREYLDCVNNISHVGHCHPHVVAALHKQASTLNTNTRYLHPSILNYAERLTATFPDPLSVVYFVNSGSEANELALRLARNYTQRRDVVVVDWAYHGNTAGLIDISPYKFARQGGRGAGQHTFVAELPDPFRGPHKGYGDDSAQAYAQSVAQRIADIASATGDGPAAFMAESISGCGGQVVYPDNYLQHAFALTRASGGVCIVDEVQVGFGRVGDHMWAFEDSGVVPDIVTIGKPMGNGHPLAAVVTTPAIAEAFANGMEFFNSFGGNPVSCEVGMAVLDVIEQEHLLPHVQSMHHKLMELMNSLKQRYPVVGDVRGKGMFLGMELVNDFDTLEPATETAGAIINWLRHHGVLLSTDGPLDNVLKFKPPIVFGEREFEFFAERLEQAFAAVCA